MWCEVLSGREQISHGTCRGVACTQEDWSSGFGTGSYSNLKTLLVSEMIIIFMV